MFLSLPVIVKLSVTVYVDLGLIFFSTASLLYLLKWAENGYPARHLILSGVFCGLALGTKYNALISLLLLASLVPILYLRGEKELSRKTPACVGALSPIAAVRPGRFRAICLAVLFVAVALLVYSPWMIRNVLWTGNPLYPLYQGVFSSIQQQRLPQPAMFPFSEEAEDGSAEEGINHFVARRLVFNESLLETLTIPIRIFFQGQDDNPRLFDGKLNPYLIIFPLFAFLPGKKAKRPFEKNRKNRSGELFRSVHTFCIFSGGHAHSLRGPGHSPVGDSLHAGHPPFICLIRGNTRRAGGRLRIWSDWGCSCVVAGAESELRGGPVPDHRSRELP